MLTRIRQCVKLNLNKLNESKKTDTLNLDLVTLYGDTFVILDATKYYNLDLKDDNLVGQPGLESITKQYLYELAYKKFIKDNEFNNVVNTFLFPSFDGNLENPGMLN